MARQKEQLPNLRVPQFLILLRDSILQLNATKTEGIFRISGNLTEMMEYREAFNNNEFWIRTTTNVHTLCSQFKMFFRDLPVPLISPELYLTFIKADFILALTCNNLDVMVLSRISPLNRDVLLFLLLFIRNLSKHADDTRMPIDNLCMVMSPGVLRCPITDPIAMLQYCELEKLFLRTLSELVPETDFGRLPFWRYPDGTEIPYTGSGFPQLSLDEVTLLKNSPHKLSELKHIRRPSDSASVELEAASSETKHSSLHFKKHRLTKSAKTIFLGNDLLEEDDADQLQDLKDALKSSPKNISGTLTPSDGISSSPGGLHRSVSVPNFVKVEAEKHSHPKKTRKVSDGDTKKQEARMATIHRAVLDNIGELVQNLEKPDSLLIFYGFIRANKRMLEGFIEKQKLDDFDAYTHSLLLPFDASVSCNQKVHLPSELSEKKLCTDINFDLKYLFSTLSYIGFRLSQTDLKSNSFCKKTIHSLRHGWLAPTGLIVHPSEVLHSQNPTALHSDAEQLASQIKDHVLLFQHQISQFPEDSLDSTRFNQLLRRVQSLMHTTKGLTSLLSEFGTEFEIPTCSSTEEGKLGRLIALTQHYAAIINSKILDMLVAAIPVHAAPPENLDLDLFITSLVTVSYLRRVQRELAKAFR